MALLLCFSYLSTTIRAQPVTSDTVRVYFLGGQSNMDGYRYSKDLPQELQMENKDVWIFHGNPVSDDLPHGGLGLWAPTRPVHGAGFSSDGQSNQLSDRFGLELTLAMDTRDINGDGRTDMLP